MTYNDYVDISSFTFFCHLLCQHNNDIHIHTIIFYQQIKINKDNINMSRWWYVDIVMVCRYLFILLIYSYLYCLYLSLFVDRKWSYVLYNTNPSFPSHLPLRRVQKSHGLQLQCGGWIPSWPALWKESWSQEGSLY